MYTQLALRASHAVLLASRRPHFKPMFNSLDNHPLGASRCPKRRAPPFQPAHLAPFLNTATGIRTPVSGLRIRSSIQVALGFRSSPPIVRSGVEQDFALFPGVVLSPVVTPDRRGAPRFCRAALEACVELRRDLRKARPGVGADRGQQLLAPRSPISAIFSGVKPFASRPSRRSRTAPPPR